MPIVRPTDARPKRPIVFGIHGEPGLGKTSLAFTAKNTVVIDFDRGADRAGIVGTVFEVRGGWQEVVNETTAGTFDEFDTIFIDTAKTALDNFLGDHVMKADYKNRRGNVLSMQGYGALGAEFKAWVNQLRLKDKDLGWIAHSKDEKENDTIIKYPSITGGSYDLLMQISDQIGYMSSVNGKRVLNFQIQDRYKSKDTAGLGNVEVPVITAATYPSFLSDLFDRVKTNLSDRASKAGAKAAVWAGLQAKVSGATDGATLTVVMNEIIDDKGLENTDKTFAKGLISTRAKELGVKYDTASKSFQSVEQPTLA